jgi:hypothetical protein
MQEKVIVEHLLVNVEVLVIVCHLFLDPLRNVFRD